MSRLLIVDGHAIAHRAYHSIPPLTVNGQPVNALYGFYSMLISSLHTLKPRYLVVCLDSPGPTFRQQEFLGYRARRKPTDRDLVTQLPLLQTSLESAKIPNFAIGGFEADDLIATITRRSLQRRRALKVTIITGDKDLMQLVNDKVELFVPIRGLSESKVFATSQVKQNLGVLPSQIIDYKALVGDMSDNYPGVTGIGPKTAVDLLTKYGSLDNIYSHLSDLGDLVRHKLESGKDDAYLSQKLATLVHNVPLKLSLKQSRWHRRSAQNLIPVFESYHFKSLLSRLHKLYPQKNIKEAQSPTQASLF